MTRSSHLPFSTSTSTSLSCWIAVTHKHVVIVLFHQSHVSKLNCILKMFVVTAHFKHYVYRLQYVQYVLKQLFGCVSMCLCLHSQSSFSLRRWISSPWPFSRWAWSVEPTRANQPTFDVCRFKPSLHFSRPIRSKPSLSKGSAEAGMKFCK